MVGKKESTEENDKKKTNSSTQNAINNSRLEYWGKNI